MLVSIITIIVTLFLGILGLIVNTMIQRKNNSIDIITKNRLNRRKETQEIMMKLIQYSNYNSIASVIALKKQSEVIQELYYNYAKLRALYTKTFEIDIDMLNECKSLLETIVEYINNFFAYDESLINAGLHNNLVRFEKVFDVYLCTEWSRIKAETIGKRSIGGIKKWISDYENAEMWYERNTSKM